MDSSIQKLLEREVKEKSRLLDTENKDAELFSTGNDVINTGGLTIHIHKASRNF